ncbi:MAG: hypothetical protein CSA62_03295 [Planctomycetota bacterium]|nr:MAG: hypothetical protein CSA62_03295 [Planctomycetota bacterium]
MPLTSSLLFLLALSFASANEPLASHERERALLELESRCRWPFVTRPDFVPVPDFVSVATRPTRLLLGGRAFFPDIDVLVAGAARAGLPFEALIPLDQDQDKGIQRFRLPLLNERITIGIELRERRPGAALNLPSQHPARSLAQRLRALASPKGPRLELRFTGLGQLLPPGAGVPDEQALLERVLLPRFRALAAHQWRPYPSGQRGLAGLKMRGVARSQGKLRRARAPMHTRDLVRKESYGLFEIESGKRIVLGSTPEDSPAEAAQRQLLERFLAALQQPTPSPDGWRTLILADDGYGRFGLQTHAAFDLGSRLWHPKHGFACLRAGNPTRSPLAAALPIRSGREHARFWSWSAQFEGYELRILAALWHVDQKSRLTSVRPNAAFGGFRSSEPRLRAIGLPKGCHAHVEFVGLFEDAPARRSLFARLRLGAALADSPPWRQAADLEAAPFQSQIHPHVQELVTQIPTWPGTRVRGQSLWSPRLIELSPDWQRRGPSEAELLLPFGEARLSLRLRASAQQRLWLLPGHSQLQLLLQGPLPQGLPQSPAARAELQQALRRALTRPAPSITD